MTVRRGHYIPKKGKPLWEYDFSYKKSRYREKGYDTKSEALTAEESKRREVKRGYSFVITNDKVTFEELVPLFIEHRRIIRAERTVNNEAYRGRQLAEHFRNRTIMQISTPEIREYVAKRKNEDGVANRAINLELSFLRSFWKFAIENHYAMDNPVIPVTNLKETRKKVWIPTKDELGMFLKACEEVPSSTFLKHWSLFRMYTGTRHHESMFVQWQDVDFYANEQIDIVPKSGNELKNDASNRVIEMHADLKKVLLNWRKEWTELQEREPEPEDWLWFNPRRKNERVNDYGKSFLKAREIAGLPKLCSKTFRHYFISNCVMSGIDFYTIAKWVGHRDTTMIQRVYAHLAPEFRAKQMKKLRFEHG